MKKTLLSISLVSLCALSSFGATTYKGDLNGDGKVDLADMVYLANAINAGSTDSSFDINASGKVDDKDLHKLADIIISGVLTENSGINVGIGGWDDDGTDYGGTVRSRTINSRSVQETSFYIRNPKASGSENRHSAEFGISDASETAVALLFNIELPSNLQFDNNSIVELDNSILDGHMLYGTPKVKMAGDNDWDKKNVLRFIIFNPTLTSFSSATGSLGRIHYSCNDTFGSSRFINCQVLNANGSEVADVHEHESDGINWHEIPVSGVTLNSSSLNLIEGDSYQMSADVYPAEATYKDIVWTSSDESVVTVDTNGYVRAISPGSATIAVESVVYPSISVTCAVTVEPRIIEVTGIVLDSNDISLKVGEMISLSATVIPEDATDKTLVWKSDNETVAKVDSDGNITATALGEATITVASGSSTATCIVRVIPTPVENITLSNTELNLTEGESATLTATVTPDDATDKGVSWTSSNPDVVTVVDGIVTAIKAGTATVTATSSNGKTATCTVTVSAKIIEASEITLDRNEVDMKVGDVLTLTATVHPDETTDKTLVWSSDNEGVASVDGTGSIVAKSLGTASIRVTCGAVTAVCVVNVVPTPVESLTLSNTELNLTEGESATLTATVTPDDATDKSVTWTTSNPDVVRVVDGIVTAIKAGTATVTATSSNGKTASCTVTVSARIIEAAEITLDRNEVDIKVGDVLTLTATIHPEDTTDKTLVWSSDNDGVASVDGTGSIVAKSLGTASIRVTCGAVTVVCVVNVVATPVESITLSNTELNLTEGESTTLIATILPEDATDKRVSWRSDNESVVTVDENGRLTAKASGTAVITAISTANSDIQSRCSVTVAANIVPVSDISLDVNELNLTEGESATLTATVTPDDATDKSVTWTSSNPDVVTVVDGIVTAIKAGTATVTATSSNGKIASCAVTVSTKIIEAAEITLDRNEVDMKVGDVLTLTATVHPEDTTDKTLVWSSDNDGVASVDGTGNIVAKSLGTASVRVSCGAVTAVCVVNVVPTPVESITLSNTELNLTEDENATLTATVTPDDATDKSVTWTSTNPDVVRVVDGIVTAIKAGTATVTATSSNGKTATCTVTVSAKVIEVTSIILDQNIVDIKVGETITLTATVLPEDATNQSIVWTSENDAIATVNAKGCVTALSIGETAVIATCGDITAKCIIHVTPILAESISITPDVWSGNEGSVFSISVVVSPENTTDKSLSWESSDTNIATVDADGTVTVMKAGECRIIVSTIDGSNLIAECAITSLAGIHSIFADDDDKVDIYSMSGVLLYHNGSREKLSQLKAGIYILRQQSGRSIVFVQR